MRDHLGAFVFCKKYKTARDQLNWSFHIREQNKFSPSQTLNINQTREKYLKTNKHTKKQENNTINPHHLPNYSKYLHNNRFKNEMRPKKIIQLRDHYNFYSSAIFVIRNTVAKIRKCAI